MQSRGWYVIGAAPVDAYTERLKGVVDEFVGLPIRDAGISPLEDIRLLGAYVRLFKNQRPQWYLSFTIKPNVYGCLAARLFNLKCLPNISGLGQAFDSRGIVFRVASRLYRHALVGLPTVFFQNQDDLQLFVDEKMVLSTQGRRIPGSGVDLERFAFNAKQDEGGLREFRFLLVGRLIQTKGILEFVEASRLLGAQASRYTIRCQLLGDFQASNPSGLDRATVDSWERAGLIEYLGSADDVTEHLINADCVMLPTTTREGVPRSLLEAAAVGRPLIASRVPGCIDIVKDGVNGFLCQPRSAEDLANKMRNMLDLSTEERERMAQRGRELVERSFDQKLVVSAYMEKMTE